MPLTIQVVTPEREVEVANDVELVVAKGVEGDVGIMPGHAPLLIALGLGPLTIVRADGRREVMAVDGGFLQVSRNQVIVLAEYAVLPEEIDAAEMERELEELRRQAASEAESGAVNRRIARAEVVQSVARM